MLSGSRFGLARHCLWWARDEVHAPRIGSDVADCGRCRHLVLECMAGTRVDAPATWGCDPKDWPAIEANIREWLPTGGITEVPIYYDGTSARTDASRERDYACRPGELPMTIDYLNRRSSSVEVWDYKTGRQEHLEAASDNGQLAICALAAAKLHGVDQAVGVLAIVADDGTARLDQCDYDSLDLDAIAYEARNMIQSIPTSQPCPGPWCSQKWCPARSVCPAMTEAIATTPIAPLSLTIDSAETCARVHTQLGLAEEFLAAVVAARNEWLKSNPEGCKLVDGSTLQWAVEERDSICLTPAALAIIESAGCSDAIEPRTSKAELERSIKRSTPKGQVTAQMRDLLAALDNVHAIKTTQYARAKVRKARS